MSSLEEDLGRAVSRSMLAFRSGRRKGWLKRTVLRVRSLVAHRIDQGTSDEGSLKRVDDTFLTNRERYRNMKRTIRRAVRGGMIPRGEYEHARKILGSCEQQYNAHPLPEKVAIEALASLALTETRGRHA